MKLISNIDEGVAMWKKVVAPTALVSLLWLAVGGATIYYINWIYHSHARDLSDKFATIQAADAMQDVLWRLQATVMEVAEKADSHTRIEVTDLENAFLGHLAEAETGSITPEEQLYTKAIRDQFLKYQNIYPSSSGLGVFSWAKRSDSGRYGTHCPYNHRLL